MVTNLLENVSSTSKSVVGSISEFVRENPVIAGSVAGGVSALGVAGLVTTIKAVRKTKKKKSTSKKRKTRRTKRNKHYRRTPRTAGRRKDRSTKRIRYTKKGQPYVITRSGKAKFIKKSSARRSHKLKGGRY